MDQLSGFLFGPNGERFDLFIPFLSWILTVPGDLLFDLLFSPESDQAYIEGHRDMGRPLGIVFWLGVLLIVLMASMYMRRTQSTAAAMASDAWRVAHNGVILIAHRVAPIVHSIAGSWTWPQIFGAAWRAEVVHIALYAGIPLLLETARAVVFVLFLPFTVMGVGEKRGLYESTFDHLSNPVCWAFVTYCPSPNAEFLYPGDRKRCQSDGNCPPLKVFSDRGGWIWKLAWAALTLGWITVWRRRQRKRAL